MGDLLAADVVMGLAAFRLWRFVGKDDLTEPLRDRFAAPGTWPDRLISCAWCSGSWIAFILVAIVAQLVSIPLPALHALAVSALVGLIGSVAK